MYYTEIIINTPNAGLKDLLIAQLSNLGFDGFEETEDGIKAYAPEDGFDETALLTLATEHGLEYSINKIADQNWNELWESNFSPMAVDDFVGVRASFHEPLQGVEHEIIITPKMSFGTGHHATTYMMMQLMRGLDLKAKTVLDFGTGTGILAILAEKLGGIGIVAIDYDDWCIENSKENIERNGCSNIAIIKADTAATNQQFDVVLANINKNIILANIDALTDAAAQNGQVLLSGLLKEDEEDILAATLPKAWRHKQTMHRNNWIAMYFDIK